MIRTAAGHDRPVAGRERTMAAGSIVEVAVEDGVVAAAVTARPRLCTNKHESSWGGALP